MQTNNFNRTLHKSSSPLKRLLQCLLKSLWSALKRLLQCLRNAFKKSFEGWRVFKEPSMSTQTLSLRLWISSKNSTRKRLPRAYEGASYAKESFTKDLNSSKDAVRRCGDNRCGFFSFCLTLLTVGQNRVLQENGAEMRWAYESEIASNFESLLTFEHTGLFMFRSLNLLSGSNRKGQKYLFFFNYQKVLDQSSLRKGLIKQWIHWISWVFFHHFVVSIWHFFGQSMATCKSHKLCRDCKQKAHSALSSLLTLD